MKTNEVNSKVNELLIELCGVEPASNESRLREDLGLDSLRMVMLLLAVEDMFEVELEESDMNPFSLITVSDVVSLATKYIK